MPTIISQPPQWILSTTPQPYLETVAAMENLVAEIAVGAKAETVWLLEHPPLYTAGVSASAQEINEASRFPVFETGRGGRMTYHGPGQRIAYVMCDLRRRNNDVHAHVWRLEEWLIRILDRLGVKGERRQGRVGIWVVDDKSESKIAAIGVRVRRGITYHGLALNVAPDLSAFAGIVPCGIKEYGVTSLEKCGINISMDRLDALFQSTWNDVFQD